LGLFREKTIMIIQKTIELKFKKDIF